MSDGMAPERGEHHWREQYTIVLEAREAIRELLDEDGAMLVPTCRSRKIVEQQRDEWYECANGLQCRLEATEKERDDLRTELARLRRVMEG
jgi:hypothetical protein